jgi:Lon-like ATP-dependent protease
LPVDSTVAMTGEISIHGNVKPIGGVYPKVKAAKEAGVKKVIIPKENMQSILHEIQDIEIVPVQHIAEVFDIAFKKDYSAEKSISASTGLLEGKESI